MKETERDNVPLKCVCSLIYHKLRPDRAVTQPVQSLMIGDLHYTQLRCEYDAFPCSPFFIPQASHVAIWSAVWRVTNPFRGQASMTRSDSAFFYECQ